ncbi:MAG: energy transducer TonB [Terriglobia bacterium]
MFSTLLDSSPLREPVLRRLHWGLSLLAGFVCFGFAFSSLHARLMPQARLALIAAAGAGLGCALQTLMLCYVFADAPRIRSRTWPWLLPTLFLSVPGFLIYLAHSARRTGDWKRAAIPMAYVLQIGLICVLVMLPLIYTEALPESQWIREVLSPPAPPARYHAPSRAVGARSVHQPTLGDLLAAPTVIPPSIQQVRDLPDPEDLVTGNTGVPGGTGAPGGVPYSLSEIGGSQPPPPPPPARKPKTIVHIGGMVEAAKLIYGPKPEYPPLARMARVQGAVKLEALISTDGTIQGLKLIGGPPLLTKAAMDAVARWRYQPTLLNGDPVEVRTEVDVVFTLAE